MAKSKGITPSKLATKTYSHPEWKYVTVLTLDGDVEEATLLDVNSLKTLETWLCDQRCWCMANEEDRLKQRASNGGGCNSCRGDAGRMLTYCPFLDMSLPLEPNKVVPKRNDVNRFTTWYCGAVCFRRFEEADVERGAGFCDHCRKTRHVWKDCPYIDMTRLMAPADQANAA